MDSNLYNQIQSDLVSSMKQRQDPHAAKKLAVLRMVVAEIKNRRIDKGADLDNEEVISVLKKAVKTREDSILQYTKAGRTELADNEKEEIDIIRDYLPAEYTEDELVGIVQEALNILKGEGVDVSSAKSFGLIMKKSQEIANGTKSINNALLSQLIKKNVSAS